MRATIQAEKRVETGKGPARRLRKNGWIPSVLYGAATPATPIQVHKKMLETAFNHVEKMHQPVVLNLGGESATVLLQDYQAHIITREFTHADFLRISESEKVEVTVPIRLTGKSQGVKEGGTLKTLERFVKLVCLPKDIPAIVEFDTTPVVIGHVIHLRDITLPDGCELALHQAELPLLAVLGKQVEEAAPAAAAPAKK